MMEIIAEFLQKRTLTVADMERALDATLLYRSGLSSQPLTDADTGNLQKLCGHYSICLKLYRVAQGMVRDDEPFIVFGDRRHPMLSLGLFGYNYREILLYEQVISREALVRALSDKLATLNASSEEAKRFLDRPDTSPVIENQIAGIWEFIEDSCRLSVKFIEMAKIEEMTNEANRLHSEIRYNSFPI